MTIIVEGFDRFAVEDFPEATVANREYDPFGWSIYSASPTQGTISTDESPISNRRGKCLTFKNKTSNSTAGTESWARFAMPTDTSWTKRILGFSLFVVSPPSSFAVGSAPWTMYPVVDPSGTGASISGDLALHIMTDGSIRFGSNSSKEIVVPAGDGVGKWIYIEIEFDKAIGGARIYVNGNLAATRTPGTTSTQWNNFGAWSITNYRTTLGAHFCVDDFYYYDDVGEAETINPLGPCKVDLKVPTSSIYEDFVPNVPAVSNAQVVGSIPIDESTFVSSTIVGSRDLHALSFPLGEVPGEEEVLAIQTHTMLRSEIEPVDTTIVYGFMDDLREDVIPAVPIVGSVVRDLYVPENPITVNDVLGYRTGYAVGTAWPPMEEEA